MSETGTNPPDWYPDPYGRHEMRYFDGTQWTEHVTSHGKQSVDAPGGTSHVPTVDRPVEKEGTDGRQGKDRRDTPGGRYEPIGHRIRKAGLAEWSLVLGAWSFVRT